MKLVIGTRNAAKLKEFELLSRLETWLSLETVPEGFSVDQTGSTFVENARKKAIKAARLTGLTALADDCGLVIEALNGRPGVHSSRYCEGTDADRRARVLAEMQEVPENNRHAAFFCAMVLADPDGSVAFTTIRCWEGMIGLQERGENGCAYDPIFFLPGRNLSVAELSAGEKNRISHRAQAWFQVVRFLRQRENIPSGQ
jgi:XTP/dITP diphosphohydrolase